MKSITKTKHVNNIGMKMKVKKTPSIWPTKPCLKRASAAVLTANKST